MMYHTTNTNGWDTVEKVPKLPTLLDVEALATWTELTEEEQADYVIPQ